MKSGVHCPSHYLIQQVRWLKRKDSEIPVLALERIWKKTLDAIPECLNSLVVVFIIIFLRISWEIDRNSKNFSSQNNKVLIIQLLLPCPDPQVCRMIFQGSLRLQVISASPGLYPTDPWDQGYLAGTNPNILAASHPERRQ